MSITRIVNYSFSFYLVSFVNLWLFVIAGPSRLPARVVDSESDEEEDDEEEETTRRRRPPPTTKKQSGVVTVVNGHTRPGPVSRPTIRLRITKLPVQSESGSSSESNNSSSSNSSSSSSESASENKRTRVQPQRAAVGKKRRRPASEDSGDSYRPAQTRRCIPTGRRRRRGGRGSVVHYHEESESDRSEERCTTRNNEVMRRRNYAPPDSDSEDEAPLGKRQTNDARPSRVTNKVRYCEASEDSDANTTTVRRTTRGKRTHYAEDSNASSDDGPALISVSSRGRIRKMTPRARAAFMRS